MPFPRSLVEFFSCVLSALSLTLGNILLAIQIRKCIIVSQAFIFFADSVRLFVLIFCILVVRLWCMAGWMGNRIDHVQ